MTSFTVFRDIVQDENINEITEIHIDRMFDAICAPSAFHDCAELVKDMGGKSILCVYYLVIRALKVCDCKSELTEFLEAMNIDFIKELGEVPVLWNKNYFYNMRFEGFITHYFTTVGSRPETIIETLQKLGNFRPARNIVEALRKLVNNDPFNPFYGHYWSFSTYPASDNLLETVPLYIYTKGERMICNDIEEFRANFKDFTFGLFEQSFSISEPFDWSNVVIAGGSVELCLRAPFCKNVTSDIDIFVFGKPEEQKAKVLYLMKWFERPGIYYIKYGSIYEIYFSDIARKVQIVIQEETHAMGIIENFDLTFIQWGFDGKNIMGTPSAFSAMRHQATTYARFDTLNKSKRGCKALEKGYQLILPEPEIVSKFKLASTIKTYRYYSDYKCGREVPKKVLNEILNIKIGLSTFYYPVMTLSVVKDRAAVILQLQREHSMQGLEIHTDLKTITANINDYGINPIKTKSIEAYIHPFTAELMEYENHAVELDTRGGKLINMDTGRGFEIVLLPTYCTLTEFTAEDDTTKIRVELVKEAFNVFKKVINAVLTEFRIKQQGITEMPAFYLNRTGLIKTIDGEVVEDVGTLPVRCQVVLRFTKSGGNLSIKCLAAVIDKKFDEISEECILPDLSTLTGCSGPEKIVFAADDWASI